MLKAADVHPAGYPTVVAVESMGKKIEAASNGRFKFQMLPGSVVCGADDGDLSALVVAVAAANHGPVKRRIV